jgi:hypothetical protein
LNKTKHVRFQSGGGAAAQANNPLADIQAFNLQNYYIPELSGGIDSTANNFVLRYAQPFGKWLMRASLPFLRVPTGPNTTQSGMGDADVFFAYLFDTGNPARSFGIGPQFSFDTASENATGAGKTQAGLAAVYFDAASQFFQWGGLLTYRTDIAGSSSRPDTSVLAAQPFYFFQLGKWRTDLGVRPGERHVPRTGRPWIRASDSHGKGRLQLLHRTAVHDPE